MSLSKSYSHYLSMGSNALYWTTTRCSSTAHIGHIEFLVVFFSPLLSFPLLLLIILSNGSEESILTTVSLSTLLLLGYSDTALLRFYAHFTDGRLTLLLSTHISTSERMQYSRTTDTLLDTRYYIPKTREIIYQVSDNPGQNLPLQPIRFTLNGADFADLRDAYVEFDVNVPENVAQNNEVITWQCENLSVATGPPTGGFFRISFEGHDAYDVVLYEGVGYTGSPTVGLLTTNFNYLAGVGADAANDRLTRALYTIPGIIELFGPYTPGGPNFVSLISTITTGPNFQIQLVNTCPYFKFSQGIVPGPVPILPTIVGNFSTAAVNLQFAITTINPGNISYPGVEYSSSSLIQRLVVEINSQPYLDIINYGNLHAILSRMKLKDTSVTNGQQLYGEGEQAFNYFAYTGRPKRYAINLLGCGIFDHILPLKLIPNVQFRITLYLQDPGLCLVQAPTPITLPGPVVINPTSQATYYVTNARIYYHSAKLSLEEERILYDKINSSSGMAIGYEAWVNFNLSNINSSSQQLLLSYNVKRFLGLLAVMQQNSYVANTQNTFKLSSFIKNQIQQIRLKIGNDYYPKDYINMLPGPESNVDVTQPLIEVMRFFGNYRPNTIDPNINEEMLVAYNYTGNYHEVIYVDDHITYPPTFVMAISTDGNAREIDDSNNDISAGIDISQQAQCVLELQGLQLIDPFNPTASETNTITTFGKYQAIWYIKGMEIGLIK